MRIQSMYFCIMVHHGADLPEFVFTEAKWSCVGGCWTQQNSW